MGFPPRKWTLPDDISSGIYLGIVIDLGVLAAVFAGAVGLGSLAEGGTWAGLGLWDGLFEWFAVVQSAIFAPAVAIEWKAGRRRSALGLVVCGLVAIILQFMSAHSR